MGDASDMDDTVGRRSYRARGVRAPVYPAAVRSGWGSVAAVTVLLALGASCGGNDRRDAAIDRVVAVPAPDGAELGDEPDHGGFEGGDPVVVDGCCPVFVYEPDDEHPDGWLGDGDTVAVRYIDAGTFADVDAACATITEWVTAVGATSSLDCADVTRVAAADADETTSFDLGGVETDRFASVELGASLLVRNGDVSAVLRIVGIG